MSLRNMALAGFFSLSLLFTAGCNTASAPIKKVASIDEAVIYQMDMFVNAEKELDKWAEEELKKRGDGVKDKPDAEKAEAFKKFQAELERKRNETLTPLKEKARAAVASAASKQGATVVLDKKIIVYGVPDITEDVTGMLKAGGDITYPEDNAEEAKTAPIGYFDQNIVRNLKVFKEAEVELFAERNKLIESMRAELEKAQQNGQPPSQAEMQAMQKAVEARLSSMQQQKMAPLLKAVSDSVEQVAKDEGLSLVLDTQHVMYGGRNLTELVVDSFLKNVGEGKSGAAEPTASESPAPAEGK